MKNQNKITREKNLTKQSYIFSNGVHTIYCKYNLGFWRLTSNDNIKFSKTYFGWYKDAKNEIENVLNNLTA